MLPYYKQMDAYKQMSYKDEWDMVSFPEECECSNLM